MTKKVDKVLVTGGAGFIGSHTVDLLVEEGYSVIILDSLDQQVHGDATKPAYLNTKARFVRGSITHKELLRWLLKEADAIIHLAGAVGVGQSMYQIEHYIDTNTRGTATLLDLLVNEDHNMKKLVVASSMSIYGEDAYFCENCQTEVYPYQRSIEDLEARRWEYHCPDCHSMLLPQPIKEDKKLLPTSIYAMSKRHQEEMCLLIGKTYSIPTVALRYFNVYGPRQSLSNPYTGACAIFLSRILNGKQPYIFEDGQQTRDFIYVEDVAKANLTALTNTGADYTAINIGTGKPTTILQLAQQIAKAHNSPLQPHISNQYRKGDIRHAYADTKKAKELLGFEAKVNLQEGIEKLVAWAHANRWLAQDQFDLALKELESKKLA